MRKLQMKLKKFSLAVPEARSTIFTGFFVAAAVVMHVTWGDWGYAWLLDIAVAAVGLFAFLLAAQREVVQKEEELASMRALNEAELARVNGECEQLLDAAIRFSADARLIFDRERRGKLAWKGSGGTLLQASGVNWFTKFDLHARRPTPFEWTNFVEELCGYVDRHRAEWVEEERAMRLAEAEEQNAYAQLCLEAMAGMLGLAGCLHIGRKTGDAEALRRDVRDVQDDAFLRVLAHLERMIRLDRDTDRMEWGVKGETAELLRFLARSAVPLADVHDMLDELAGRHNDELMAALDAHGDPVARFFLRLTVARPK